MAIDPTKTRGYRNCNPLNIRAIPHVRWEGQKGVDKDGFCQFVSMFYGVRAAFAILRNYKFRHNVVTIADIISRWAPSNENNTQKYISDVCRMLGKAPEYVINYRSLDGRRLIRAMAIIECNYELDPNLLFEAQSKIL